MDRGGAATAGPEVTLEGASTVEAWVNLAAPIDNQDSLLAAGGVLDMNFYGEKFRVWTKGQHDIVVAASKTTPDAWTHYAVTRDAEGVFRISIDGELDAESQARETIPYPDLRVVLSTTRGGTQGRIAEFRVWNEARTAAKIRADFDRSFVGDAERPPSLVTFHGGTDWGALAGDARVEPALDGLWLTGAEAILRNVLTPNAAMEGGYRAFRVVTRDGRVVHGLLVSQDAEAIVIRQPDTADLRIPARDVARTLSVDYDSYDSPHKEKP